MIIMEMSDKEVFIPSWEPLKTDYLHSLRRNQKHYPGSEYDENILC